MKRDTTKHLPWGLGTTTTQKTVKTICDGPRVGRHRIAFNVETATCEKCVGIFKKYGSMPSRYQRLEFE